jgi:pimeloyl-ACP methyl ester carboxylesterase
VILLHGFPEFWWGWRHQIAPLLESGYRVWVPDQRGYNLSDKPPAIADYRLDKLADDIVGLIGAAGVEHAYIVGHDWGAAVAWRLAGQAPQVVRKLAILNVPHNRVMRRFLLNDWRQRLRSWYFFFFLLPYLPETFSRLGNWNATIRGMKSIGLPTSFAGENWEPYRAAWNQPYAFRSMINWYRAILTVAPPHLPSPRITMPTLLLWGMQDGALRHEMAQASIEFCDRGQLVMVPHASHWIQHDIPDEVNQHLIRFLKEESPPPTL